MRDAKCRFLPGNPYRMDSATAKLNYARSINALCERLGVGETRAKQLLWKRLSGQWDGIKREHGELDFSQKRRRRGGHMADGY
jgi:hypothetical protein